ncbi:ABC transporter ATP-binding protein (plasmid) [Clostridium perfringens]|uniref:ABC transporter ATP-binding protein n=1 Tax=Clostridium perfringens TaxID=1502 RepID=UPI0030D3BF4C
MKKLSAINLIIRIYKSIFKIVPISGILSQIYYLIQGLFPAFITFITALLFNSVSNFFEGKVQINEVYFYGIIIFVAYIIKIVLQYISSITINAGIYEKCVYYNNIELVKKISRLKLLDFENSETMNFYIRAKECVSNEKISSIYMSLAVLITNGIGTISVIMVLAQYNFWFVVISIFSVIPYFVIRIIRGKEFYYMKYEQAKNMRKENYLWGLLTSKTSIKEMKTLGFSNYINSLWIKVRKSLDEEIWEQNKREAISLLFCDIIKGLGYSISIILTLILAINGQISIGVFGACLVAFTSVQEQIKSLLIQIGLVYENISYANDYFTFLDLPEEINSGVKYTGLKKEIELKKVCFNYPNTNKLAIDNISIKFKKGEKIAIIGENGSGKTTLSKLILGVYKCTIGNVFYDDIDVDLFNSTSFYNKVSIINQRYITYLLSLRENVAISNLKKLNDDNEIIKILNNVGLNNLIINKNNLNRQVGVEFGGIELSGGQSQRLSIAKGIFKESELIVLDEPTSALDPIIENDILKKFIEIAGDKTTFIISHRVGLCKFVDKIVVMKNGKIVEVGSHDELIVKNGEYKRIFTAQQKWYI